MPLNSHSLFCYQVILAGGSSKMPSLQAKLRQKFPDAELLNHIPGDECIAIGAAKQVCISYQQ